MPGPHLPGTLKVLKKYLTSAHTVKEANSSGKDFLAPNILIDSIIRQIKDAKARNAPVPRNIEILKNAFPSWTGLLVCYVEPEVSFLTASLKDGGKYIVRMDEISGIAYRMPLPQSVLDEHGNEIPVLQAVNRILAINHDKIGTKPNFSFEYDGTKKEYFIDIADFSGMRCLPFPKQNGVYEPDGMFGIPIHNSLSPAVKADWGGKALNNSRVLLRRQAGNISLVSRELDYMGHDDSRMVGTGISPSLHFGSILVEARA
jgi:hypothetical protein